LEIPVKGSAALNSKTVWGALRGLETFSQMVHFNFTSGVYEISQVPLKITDAPRFAWRGLMVDTSRHFLPLPALRSIIDSLLYAKVNVLHWHMSDTQSFPMQLESRPKLWDAAFSPQERYLLTDVKDIVEYARLRGVRIVPEFDMPGHAGSWCAGYPEVCPSSSCQEPLNIASNETFDLIEDVLHEVSGGKRSSKGSPSGVFPDDFMHLGGDEVDTKCWTRTNSTKRWLADRKMSADDGYAYFVKRAAEVAREQGRRPVQWVEVFEHFRERLDKQTVIHVWKDKKTLKEVVDKGFDGLLSNAFGVGNWYLDHLDVPWDKIYNDEPCEGITLEVCMQKVLGGQGQMWGETVDISDLESTVWPRMAAIAERLWSPMEVSSVDSAKSRLTHFRCLLNARGVRSAPVTYGKARSAPSGPGGCWQELFRRPKLRHAPRFSPQPLSIAA